MINGSCKTQRLCWTLDLQLQAKSVVKCFTNLIWSQCLFALLLVEVLISANNFCSWQLRTAESDQYLNDKRVCDCDDGRRATLKITLKPTLDPVGHAWTSTINSYKQCHANGNLIRRDRPDSDHPSTKSAMSMCDTKGVENVCKIGMQHYLHATGWVLPD